MWEVLLVAVPGSDPLVGHVAADKSPRSGRGPANDNSGTLAHRTLLRTKVRAPANDNSKTLDHRTLLRTKVRGLDDTLLRTKVRGPANDNSGTPDSSDVAAD
jgi:hypothetical protein